MELMATNAVFPYTETATEIWTFAATTAPGVAVVGGVAGAQPGVTLTGTGDYTKSQVVGPYTISGIPAGGVSLAPKDASVATDGTWEFPVTGGLTTTPQNTLVYAVVSSGVVTGLTLTASTNKPYGKVNYTRDYVKTAGVLPVKIGVFA